MNRDERQRSGRVTDRGQLEIRTWWGRALVGRRPARTLVRLVLLVAVTFLVTKWCLLPIRVTGRSMEPTYRSGRINALNLLAYQRGNPRRGDVVGIKMRGRRMILLKRVLGLPGEQVTVRDGTVHINGTPLNEPYARGRGIPSMSNQMVLGPSQYFVIGDNRDLSDYGPVERDEITGKALF